MKFISLFITLLLFTYGCTTMVSTDIKDYSHKSKVDKTSIDEIKVYFTNDFPNVPHKIIGSVNIGDTGLTTIGGDLESVINDAVEKGYELGGDAILIKNVKEPDWISTIYRIEADIIVWGEGYSPPPILSAQEKIDQLDMGMKLEDFLILFPDASLLQHKMDLYEDTKEPYERKDYMSDSYSFLFADGLLVSYKMIGL